MELPLPEAVFAWKVGSNFLESCVFNTNASAATMFLSLLHLEDPELVHVRWPEEAIGTGPYRQMCEEVQRSEPPVDEVLEL